MIYASVKGFGPGPYEDCKVYENVAQCTGGSASTTGFDDGRRWSPAPRSAIPAPACTSALGIVTALFQRETTGRGQRVVCAMQDGVLEPVPGQAARPAAPGPRPLKEYPQYPNGEFGEATPRAGNASGGGQPGWAVQVQGLGGPNDYIYVIIQAPGWALA